LLSALPLTSLALQAQPLIGHDLEVWLSPDEGELRLSDTLNLPEDQPTWTLWLHQGLNPSIAKGEARLERLGGQDHLDAFRLHRLGPGPITLRMAGPIQGELATITEGMGRSHQWTNGIISAEGVMLDGNSGWYPRVPDSLQRFSLQVDLPSGWTAISQGAGPQRLETAAGTRVTWREDQPQDEIYLIAAPFVSYVRPTPRGEAQVYLRTPDTNLAQRYLDATADYLNLYSDLIGPYPYAKFALVENFWETGYGMPSFTLLGAKVIRLPFILQSSYPHEILHNWWGNSVYIDYATGNWSEGLTAYLADHFLKEREGQGAQYRRDSLQAYADYVRQGEDFPLTAFRARHGAASQAIGYGKGMMLFHNLRHDLGDETFLAGLRRFYRDNAFRTAGFDQLRQAFEQASGLDLKGFFAAWTQRTGAPELALSRVSLEPPAAARAPGEEGRSNAALAEVPAAAGDLSGMAAAAPNLVSPNLAGAHPATEARSQGGYRLVGQVAQTQPEGPYPLQVPLLIHLEDGSLIQRHLPMRERTLDFAIDLPAAPLHLALDPEFDLFRRLAPGENPPSLSALFGAERGLIILATAEPAPLAEGYRQLAESWIAKAPGWKLAMDDKLERLPEALPVWLLGWSNLFLPALRATSLGLDQEQRRLELAGQRIAGDDLSLALVREQAGRPLGLIATGLAEALPGLARKLPHYGKFGYLAFTGTEPDNRLKGQWPSGTSRLAVWFSEERPLSAPPRSQPLGAEDSPSLSAARPGDRD